MTVTAVDLIGAAVGVTGEFDSAVIDVLSGVLSVAAVGDPGTLTAKHGPWQRANGPMAWPGLLGNPTPFARMAADPGGPTVEGY